MSNGTLMKVAAKTAAEVCKHFSPGDEAKKLLRDGMTTRQYLDVLVQKEQFPDAARFLAHALPKREAVWWACMCADAVPDPALAGADAAARVAAEAWVRKPTEEPMRRAAWDAAQKTAYRSAEAWAAVGAFWSGGSMAPSGRVRDRALPRLVRVVHVSRERVIMPVHEPCGRPADGEQPREPREAAAGRVRRAAYPARLATLAPRLQPVRLPRY